MITPADLKAYSVFPKVKSREDTLLQSDILEAETEIYDLVGHDFSQYTPNPEKALLAVKKMAQFYALINSDESITKGFKSEKIGDYSYQLADGNTIKKPDVSHLLKEFVDTTDGVPSGSRSVNLRMRSL